MKTKNLKNETVLKEKEACKKEETEKENINAQDLLEIELVKSEKYSGSDWCSN
jgi:hypothetical protein